MSVYCLLRTAHYLYCLFQERNFHVFYYIFAGLPKDLLKKVHLRVSWPCLFIETFTRIYVQYSQQCFGARNVTHALVLSSLQVLLPPSPSFSLASTRRTTAICHPTKTPRATARHRHASKPDIDTFHSYHGYHSIPALTVLTWEVQIHCFLQLQC